MSEFSENNPQADYTKKIESIQQAMSIFQHTVIDVIDELASHVDSSLNIELRQPDQTQIKNNVSMLIIEPQPITPKMMIKNTSDSKYLLKKKSIRPFIYTILLLASLFLIIILIVLQCSEASSNNQLGPKAKTVLLPLPQSTTTNRS